MMLSIRHASWAPRSSLSLTRTRYRGPTVATSSFTPIIGLIMKATSQDITRLFSGIDAHTVLEVLKSEPSVSDLGATVLVLQGENEGLVDLGEHQRANDSRLISLLEAGGIRVPREEDELP